MNKEEIEELKEFTIDLNDIDDLALGLEVCSKKSNYEGQPVKCRYCGSENLKDCNEEIGGYNIPEGCLCEYDVCCEECGEVVAHYAYGKWSY